MLRVCVYIIKSAYIYKHIYLSILPGPSYKQCLDPMEFCWHIVRKAKHQASSFFPNTPRALPLHLMKMANLLPVSDIQYKKSKLESNMD